ncbi:MAG: DUF4129 domain-containing protein [Lapillicoccus sp.]
MRLPSDLDPSTDQARQWLSDELARSEYQDTRSLFQQVMDWVLERLADLQGTQGTGGVSLPPVVITIVVVLLVAGLGAVLTRVRVESRAVKRRPALLGDTVLTAEQLRALAEAALHDGRYDDAVLAWTRAIARDAERRTLLPDAPSMTAHEVGAALAVVFPTHATAVDRTIDRFDAVAYGDARATRDDALAARSTDEALRTARPVLTASRPAPDRPDDPPPPVRSAEPDAPSVWMTGVGS